MKSAALTALHAEAILEQNLITGMARAHRTAPVSLNKSVNKEAPTFIYNPIPSAMHSSDVMLSGHGGLWSRRLPPEVRGPGRCVVRVPGHLPALGQQGRGGGGVSDPGGRDYRRLGSGQTDPRLRRAGLHPVRQELHHHRHDRGDTPGEGQHCVLP